MHDSIADKQSSRRDFLASAGAFAAGALATGGIIHALAPAKASAAQALPWPYLALDPQAVAEAAYNGYKTAGCMYGTGKALVDALAAATGSPWNTFNPDLMRFGAGGIAHWGTVCGSVNAGVTIIQMVAGPSVAALTNEYMGWACDFAFPSARVDHLSLYPNQPTSVAKSPLCHNSSGKWAYAYGYRINSAERKERCAKVAADSAYKAAELLNAWLNNAFTPENFPPDYQDETNFERCFTCHVGETSKYDNAQGKMNCLTKGCHPEKATHKL